MGIVYYATSDLETEEKNKYFTSLDICRRKSADTGCLYPAFCVGFYNDGACIKTAPAVEKAFSSSAEIDGMYGHLNSSTDKNAMLAKDSSGTVYYSDLSSAFAATPVSLGGSVTAVPYTDTSGGELTLLLSDDKAYKYDGETGTFTLMSSVPACICAQVHSERLFTVDEDGYTVRFSRALDIEDWTEEEQGAGYVKLPSEQGDIISMISFNGYLYLFRRRGITRLRAMGDNMNFQHIELDVRCGEIYKNGIVLCGKYAVFAAEGGAFLFDGVKAEPLDDEVTSLVDLSSVSSCARFGPCAVMCVKLKGAFPAVGLSGISSSEVETAAYSAYSSSGGRAVLLINTREKAASLLPYPAVHAANIGAACYIYDESGRLGRLYAADGENGEYMGETLSCVWDSGLTDFSLGGGRKLLRRLYIKGEGNYTAAVYNEKRTVRFSCEGNGVLRPMLTGREFGLRISSDNAKIYSVEVSADEY